MQCLTDNGGGSFTTAAPQPTDYTACTYLLVQPSELQPQIFNLTAEEGVWLGFQLSLILVVGFIFRAVARALSTDERFQNEE
jgi:hypothetical protein